MLENLHEEFEHINAEMVSAKESSVIQNETNNNRNAFFETNYSSR